MKNFATYFVMALIPLLCGCRVVSTYQSPWLGVSTVDSLSEDIGSEDRNDTPVVITQVYDRSPALTAGLAVGDRILEFAGTKIERFYDLIDTLHTLQGGQSVPIVVERNQEELEMAVTVENTEWKKTSRLGIDLPLIEFDPNFSIIVLKVGDNPKRLNLLDTLAYERHRQTTRWKFVLFEWKTRRQPQI